MASGDARPGREVVAEEEGGREEVDGAHGDSSVLVRQPGGRPPQRLGFHPVDGGGVELAGESGGGTTTHQPERPGSAAVRFEDAFS